MFPPPRAWLAALLLARILTADISGGAAEAGSAPENLAPPVRPVVVGYGQGVFRIGPLLHQDDFENLENWVPQVQQRGAVEPHIGVRDGKLEAVMEDAAATIWFRHKLEGPIAIVYRVRARRTEAQRAGFMARDINCFWHARDPVRPERVIEDARRYTGAFGSYDQQLGYYASIGGGQNTTTRFRRYPRAVDGSRAAHLFLFDKDGRDAYRIEPDREYRIQLVAYDDLIQFIVDGKPYYEIRAGDTVTMETASGERREVTYTRERFSAYTEGWFGFRLTSSHHEYADFRVYRLEPDTDGP